ncbi:thioredoxin family protein [Ancylomarina sp. DW003]|nr:thioredoxin family protein [Ancylomarina sp. DW003]MDE5424175.1 thioredoxin family protein [Ancylomarina sp. DW003]
MKLLKVNLSFLVLLLAFQANAQINWLDSYDMAKEIAKEQNKLIIVDCWATWCGPCVKMDDEVWPNEQITQYADSFVFVKIDMSSRAPNPNFKADAIPKIFITDAWHSRIRDYTGYQNKSKMNSILRAFKFDISEIYEVKEQVSKNKKDANLCLKLAMVYQKTSYNLERDARVPMRYLSDNYFKKAIKEFKNTRDMLGYEKALLLSCMNKNSKKCIKLLLKIKTENEDNLKLKNAILAKAYLNLEDTGNAKKYFEPIKLEKLPYYDFLEKERIELN